LKILSIIPARAGSKGLPGKNIMDLAGNPLISYTIEASLKSKFITKTIVSSDSDEILEIAKKYGSDILKRPHELAQDTTASEPVISHVLENIENIEEYEYIVLLQPTSPLRDENDIDKAFNELFQEKATSLISTVAIDNKILKAFMHDENGFLKGVSNNSFPFMRRQDLPSVFLPNGAIYICDIKEFQTTKKLFTEKTISYLMSDKSSIDVDTLEDLIKIKKLIESGDKNE
jgi:CMP-N-acetylneuraminic acid synthetase